MIGINGEKSWGERVRKRAMKGKNNHTVRMEGHCRKRIKERDLRLCLSVFFFFVSYIQ